MTSGDGNTYTMSGEQSQGRGSSTITGADGSITTDTVRNDGRSATAIEGSGGGKALSVSGEGPGRTTVGQSGSGDTYAGYNGNIYKQTDDGWQRYDNGQWKPAESSPYVPRERPPGPVKVAPAVPAASTPVAPATPAPHQRSRKRAAGVDRVPGTCATRARLLGAAARRPAVPAALISGRRRKIAREMNASAIGLSGWPLTGPAASGTADSAHLRPLPRRGSRAQSRGSAGPSPAAP